MTSIRRARKDLRKAVLQSISTGGGSIEKLLEIAEQHFGHDVGYIPLIRCFLNNEVSNAVSCLRKDGHIETIGKKWKAASQLHAEDVEIISKRRLKRIRGELKSEVELAHKFGNVEDAVFAAKLLGMLSTSKETVHVQEGVES